MTEINNDRIDQVVLALLFLGAAGSAGMSKRMLVVEDQENNRQIIRDMLSATDYEITEVRAGAGGHNQGAA